MMTMQEIFDKVARHLLTQGKKSENPDPGPNDAICLYRGPEGMRCAIGVLIDDEHYRSTLENMTTAHADLRLALDASGIPTTSECLALLDDLQDVHDSRAPDEWPEHLYTVAGHRRLSAAVLDEFAVKP